MPTEIYLSYSKKVDFVRAQCALFAAVVHLEFRYQVERMCLVPCAEWQILSCIVHVSIPISMSYHRAGKSLMFSDSKLELFIFKNKDRRVLCSIADDAVWASLRVMRFARLQKTLS